MNMEYGTDAARVQVHHADVQRWCAENRVPKENLHFSTRDNYVDPMILIARLDAFVAKKQVSFAEVERGALPSSLWDWLKFHATNALPFLSRWLVVRTTPLMQRNETRVCPHLSVREQRHLDWMTYGDEFGNENNEKARAAMYAVFHAAVAVDFDNPDIYGATYPILRAVMRYRKVVGE